MSKVGDLLLIIAEQKFPGDYKKQERWIAKGNWARAFKKKVVCYRMVRGKRYRVKCPVRKQWKVHNRSKIR